MALGGIGGNGASPLDRFQQARDLARRKIDGEDNRARLADLLKQKQAQLGSGLAAGGQPAAQAGAASAPAVGGALGFPAAIGGMGGASAYGRTAGAQKPDPRPGLGRFIDLTA